MLIHTIATIRNRSIVLVVEARTEKTLTLLNGPQSLAPCFGDNGYSTTKHLDYSDNPNLKQKFWNSYPVNLSRTNVSPWCKKPLNVFTEALNQILSATFEQFLNKLQTQSSYQAVILQDSKGKLAKQQTSLWRSKVFEVRFSLEVIVSQYHTFNIYTADKKYKTHYFLCKYNPKCCNGMSRLDPISHTMIAEDKLEITF